MLLRTLVSLTVSVSFTFACASLVAAESDDDLVELVLNLLNDKDKDVRALGLEQVRTEAKGQVATLKFSAQLPKSLPDAQVALLGALADRGDNAARVAVIDLLTSSKDETVRVAAIEALGSLGSSDDFKLLLTRGSSESKAESAAARKSLVRLRGEDVTAQIVAEMNQSPAPLRVTLIEVLASRRALAAIPDLLSAAVDADPNVRAAAMTALGQLAALEHIPGLLQGVLKSEKGREREAAEKSVMFVCVRVADVDNRAAPLLAAIESLPDADRTALLPTLGRVGGSAALKVVEAAIADPDVSHHENGFRALCNWPDASVSARIIELAEKDQHADHRAMARGALIRVAPLPDKRSDDEKLALLKKVMSMCDREDERKLVLSRARAIRSLQTLRFVAPYMEEPKFAQQACETVVELAHHRALREPNKAEFDRALDKVMERSKNATVVERASRYKKGLTWTPPIAAKQP